EIELHVAIEISGAGAGDDLHASKSDAAELGAVRIIVDSDFLNLVLGRKASAAETIDHETAGTATCIGATARAGDLLQVVGKFRFVVGQFRDGVTAKRCGGQA